MGVFLRGNTLNCSHCIIFKQGSTSHIRRWKETQEDLGVSVIQISPNVPIKFVGLLSKSIPSSPAMMNLLVLK